jgi:hypothetical protein
MPVHIEATFEILFTHKEERHLSPSAYSSSAIAWNPHISKGESLPSKPLIIQWTSSVLPRNRNLASLVWQQTETV